MWEEITVQGELAADSGGDTAGCDAGVQGSVGLLVEMDQVSNVSNAFKANKILMRHGTMISSLGNKVVYLYTRPRFGGNTFNDFLRYDKKYLFDRSAQYPVTAASKCWGTMQMADLSTSARSQRAIVREPSMLEETASELFPHGERLCMSRNNVFMASVRCRMARGIRHRVRMVSKKSRLLHSLRDHQRRKICRILVLTRS